MSASPAVVGSENTIYTVGVIAVEPVSYIRYNCQAQSKPQSSLAEIAI